MIGDLFWFWIVVEMETPARSQGSGGRWVLALRGRLLWKLHSRGIPFSIAIVLRAGVLVGCRPGVAWRATASSVGFEQFINEAGCFHLAELLHAFAESLPGEVIDLVFVEVMLVHEF